VLKYFLTWKKQNSMFYNQFSKRKKPQCFCVGIETMNLRAEGVTKNKESILEGLLQRYGIQPLPQH
jgi:hypothetical protein